MTRILIILLFSLISYHGYSTHAAGMDISYQCISSGTVGTPTTTLIGYGSVVVDIQTVTWANEISWTITNSAGVVVAQGGQGSAYSNNSSYQSIYCLPPGNYTFNWFDSWGDGWNGGSYSLSDVNGSFITSGAPTTGSSGSSSFTIADPCANIYQTTYIGGTPDTYKVTVKFYRDCDGISAPGSLNLNYYSASCGVNQSITLTQTGSGTVITPICPTMNSTCTGGNVIGIEEYTYEANINIAKCPDWIFSVQECCRNNAISTINAPGTEELRIEATLNNLTLCNNSPSFTQNPVPYICANTPYCYNNGAVEPDGDSLVYSLITPLTGGGSVVYNNGYSVNNPVGGTTTFNYLTGNLCMNPPSPLTSVVAIKVEEYRNGVLIGSIIRDIQVNVLNCTEPPPYLTGIDTLASVDSDPTGTISTYNLCTDGNTTINFNIGALTNSTVTNLNMSWNNAIPSASFSVSNNSTPNPVGVFSWNPSLLDVANSPYYFVVTVIDDACPLMSTFSYAYQINLNYSSGSYIKSDVSCFGLQDGTIDLSVIGGYPPYSYYWLDSVSGFTSSLEDLSNLDQGHYYCFITDSIGDTLGCGLEPIDVIIDEPPILSVTSNYTEVSCYSSNDGQINLVINGGVPPYNVAWSSSNGYISNLQNISSLPAGVYTAIISDANNCGPLIETISITEPSPMSLFGIENHVSCFGYNDGSIDLTSIGTGVNYNWSGPNAFFSNSEDINNLSPGNYIVSIFDTNGCIGPSLSFIIIEPSDITVVDSIIDVSCFSLSDGEIHLTISGGVGGYSTIWNGTNSYFSVSEDIFSLSAGNYNYTISDDNGCIPSINNSPLIINQPQEVVTSSIVVNESCLNLQDGSIDVTISTPGTYSYSWVGPNFYTSNSLDIFNLEPGTYNLTILDQNGCSNQISEFVSNGSYIQVNNFIQDVTCNGFADGTILLLTPNSNSAFFNWSGPLGFYSVSNYIDSLTPGNYSVLVNDSSNCPIQLLYSINEPSNISVSSIVVDESCEGYSDGSIVVTATGGVQTYSYVWSNGSIDSINDNLSAGQYVYNVLDANNCIFSDTLDVFLYLFDTIVNVMDVSCFNGIDGSIDLEINGGTPPFNYLWSNNVTTQDLLSIGSAVYTISITDATNCSINRDIIVNQPSELVVTTNVTNILCYGDSNGTVSFQINGGVYPYVFDFGISDSLALNAGYHTYSVIDDNLCKLTDSILIVQNDSMQIIANITDVNCNGEFTGQIELQITQGTGAPPYSYSWIGPNGFTSSLEDIYGLEAGIYLVTVSDNNNCVQNSQFLIDEPLSLSQVMSVKTSNYSGYNIRCIGDNSGWIKINVDGGYSPHQFLWDFGSISDSVYNLSVGSYTVTVTDSLGCFEFLTIYLNEPLTKVETDIVSVTDFNGYNVSCNGYNDAGVQAVPFGGVSPYTFLWNNMELSQSLSNIYAGYYEVIVYDNNQCIAIDSITLYQPEELDFDLEYFPDTCNRGVGKAEVFISGGVSPYFPNWSNGSISLVENSLNQGSYLVDVIDNNGCSKKSSFNIDNLLSPIADFEAYPYHQRFIDQKSDPFFFVDISTTYWSNIKFWNWDFGDLNTATDSIVSHSYSEHGEYTVTLEIITEHNCIDTITKNVVVDEYSIYIPNSFIPSSNNKENNIFKSYGIGINSFEMKIFSRWGELLFESKNIAQGWDGTHRLNGTLCPHGIYTYTVFVENIYGETFEYQGQLKLLR